MTKLNDHERARFLMIERSIGPLPATDAMWLAEHLVACPSCAKREAGLEGTVRALRQEPISAPPFLAARTRASVHARARQMTERRERVRLLSIMTAVTVFWTLMTTLGFYQAWQWTGATLFGMTPVVFWALAFTWLWILPAIAGLGIVMMQRNGNGEALRRWTTFADEGGIHE